jgi:hypothetical protein
MNRYMVTPILSIILVLAIILPPATTAQQSGTLEIVSTFHSLSVYWNPVSADRSRLAQVQYRPTGSNAQWADGYPLWYSQADDHYRGSIVHLQPGTTYEIKLTLLGTSETETLTATTWSESFPVAKVVKVGNRSDTLRITEGGSPEGYVVYENGVIDTDDKSGIVINADYVMVRNVTIIGAKDYGMYISLANHIVIEGCDIDQYGDYGIKVMPAVENVIIQRNTIHDPTWGLTVQGNSGSLFGIYFQRAGGNHVIRYNAIYSDADHQVGDCIGGSENFSTAGFPNHDSDIYGNYLANCADNAIETEGGNRNVRVWGNYITDSYNALASRDTRVGPIYFWRNVSGDPLEGYSGGPLVRLAKNGGESTPNYSQGEFWFHNTILPGYEQAMEGRMGNTTTRNNIFDVSDDVAINNYSGAQDNDFDWDLIAGSVRYGSFEAHGIKGRPTYVNGAGLHQDGARYWGTFTLDTSSPGYNAGIVIPNFNTGYTTGDAPDMGAHESGMPPMEFGVMAYLNGEPYGEVWDNQPEPTATPTATNTPVWTATPTPAITSTPTATNTPTATSTPELGKVWVLVSETCTEVSATEMICTRRYEAK